MRIGGRNSFGVGKRGMDYEDTEIHAVKTYWRLLKYVKPYWHWMLLTLLLSLMTAFTGLLPQQVIGIAVNDLTKQTPIETEETLPASGKKRVGKKRPTEIPIAPAVYKSIDLATNKWFPKSDPTLVKFLTFGAVFIALFIISMIISIGQRLTMAYLGKVVVLNLRNKTYSHLQKLSLKFFEEGQTGDIMARVIGDISSLEQVIVGPVVDLLTDLARLIFLLYFCFSWDPSLTSLALVITPLLIGTTWIFGKILRKYFRKLRKKMGELNARLQDNITGIRVIKACGAEKQEEETFVKVNTENYKLQLKLIQLFNIFRPSIELMNNVGTVLVLVLGGMKVAQGEMEVGVFIIFFAYIRLMFQPINGLTRFYHHIQRALASVERVFVLLDEKPTIVDAPDAVELKSVTGKMEISNLSFSYDEEHGKALDGVSFKVNPGEMVAVVGPSGAGKTTIVNMLLRFYDPTEGTITIDGHDLKNIKNESLRKHISVVLQDPFLFNDTIKNNINFARPDATEEEITEAARSSGAEEFIISLPDKYDTVIGERGVKLSGGQRQRISIARAVLADPRILLLDEATSSVDNETESLIQEAIYRMAKDRTTVVIAHRLSTVQNADRIIVLESGKVVETGKHEELIKIKNGLYRRLYESGSMNGSKKSGKKEDNQKSEKAKWNSGMTGDFDPIEKGQSMDEMGLL